MYVATIEAGANPRVQEKDISLPYSYISIPYSLFPIPYRDIGPRPRQLSNYECYKLQ